MCPIPSQCSWPHAVAVDMVLSSAHALSVLAWITLASLDRSCKQLPIHERAFLPELW